MKVVFHYFEKWRSSSIVLKSESCLLLCWKVEVIFHCIKKWRLSSIMLKSWGQQKIRLHFTLQKFEVVIHFEENKTGWDDFLLIQEYSRQPVGQEPGGLENKDNSAQLTCNLGCTWQLNKSRQLLSTWKLNGFNGTWHQKILKWKTTSKILKMEDDHERFENGRWP